MAEICWFCKDNPADAEKTIVLPIYKVLEAEQESFQHFGGPSGTKTEFHYKRGSIDILRCKKCAEIHAMNQAKADKSDNVKYITMLVGTVVIAVIGYLLRQINSMICIAGVVWFVFIMAAILIKDEYAKSLGQLESALYTLPEVTSILKSGWKAGTAPKSGDEAAILLEKKLKKSDDELMGKLNLKK